MPNVDVISYSGEVNLRGYSAVCEQLSKRKGERALLVLCTPGGNADAGFRIARALQHDYGNFDALVPRYCKSAGTLMLIGAERLYLDDMSELGPLDVQVKKGDEVMGRNSGLDILQAINYLQVQALGVFGTYLASLTQEVGLSTRIASDIASKLTTGLFEPVFAQIDPMKLAEMQRALEIALAYGTRLNEKSRNLKPKGLTQLVTGYPSHGFVIDRKEAKSIFNNVERPEGKLAELSKALQGEMEKNTYATTPVVNLYSLTDLPQGATNEATPNAGATTSAGGAQAGDAAVNGGGKDQPAAGPAPAAQGAKRTRKRGGNGAAAVAA